MKTTTYILTWLLIAYGSTSFAQNNQQPYLKKAFRDANIRHVNVKTSGGSINIMGGNAADAHIEVYVNPNNGNDKLSQEELTQRMQDYTLEVAISGTELEVSAKPKSTINWRKSLNISFKIFVPKTVSSNLTTSGGSISLSDLTGDQNFTTSGGSLNINGITGNIKGHTSGGSIHVSNSQNKIELGTSGGNITAKNCKGNIMLSTSGGSLQLNNLDGEISAKTSGGSVNGNNIFGQLQTGTSGGSVNLTNLSCSLETSTSAGSINVQVKQLGKYVKINGSVGHVDLELPAGKGLDLDLHGNRINVNVNGNFNGQKTDDSMVGKLNGGGVPITVHTNVGGINVMM